MNTLVRSPKQIGVAIRKIRRAKDLNQTQLSERAGLRQATVSNIENGDGATRLATFCDVLAALDLELIVRQRTLSGAQDIEDIF